MEGFDFGENQDNMRLLMEIEDLKRTLEEERNNHNLEISMMQVCQLFFGLMLAKTLRLGFINACQM